VKTFTEWLVYGGRDHFHHYLVDVGFLPRGAVVFIYWVTFSLCISAVMVSNDRSWEAFLAILQSMIVFGVIAHLMIVGRRRRSGWSRQSSSDKCLKSVDRVKEI
jgi:small-conductance mechanosensitive channel